MSRTRVSSSSRSQIGQRIGVLAFTRSRGGNLPSIGTCFAPWQWNGTRDVPGTRIPTSETTDRSLAPARGPDDYDGEQLARPSAGGTIPRQNTPRRLVRRGQTTHTGAVVDRGET